MNDKNLGMVLATVIAAPVMIVCCGGLGFLVSALAGATGLFTGLGGLPSVLLAIAAGGLMLALLRYWRSGDDCERPNSASEPRP